jgi:hypothetical protein
VQEILTDFMQRQPGRHYLLSTNSAVRLSGSEVGVAVSAVILWLRRHVDYCNTGIYPKTEWTSLASRIGFSPIVQPAERRPSAGARAQPA